jgi:hypothetical protein
VSEIGQKDIRYSRIAAGGIAQSISKALTVKRKGKKKKGPTTKNEANNIKCPSSQKRQ